MKSTLGFTCGHFFLIELDSLNFIQFKAERHAHEILNSFVHEVGIMNELHSDNANTLFQGEMAKKIRRFEIYQTFSKPYSQWQNFAKNRIKQVRNTAQYFLQWKNTPIRLWTYAFVYATEILNQIVSTHVASHGQNPFEMIHGYTPDISEYVSFEWYEAIWFQHPTDYQSQQLGRWLGVADTIGSGHVFHVITNTGNVISTSSVTHLTDEDRKEDQIIKAILNLDNSIESKIGNYREQYFKVMK